MAYWREELKDNPELFVAYANLLDASENNVPAFEREVRRQGKWDEYQQWRKARDTEHNKSGANSRVTFSAGKKIISGVVALLTGKEKEYD
jgi:hypothetical protein